MKDFTPIYVDNVDFCLSLNDTSFQKEKKIDTVRPRGTRSMCPKKNRVPHIAYLEVYYYLLECQN